MRNFQINVRNKLIAKCILTFSHYARPHLKYGTYVYVKNKLGSQICSLVYKFIVWFIRLENLVYQNNPFICCRATSIQHATLNQVNITKRIFLNMYHFPSTLVLLKYQDPFIEYAILLWTLEF